MSVQRWTTSLTSSCRLPLLVKFTFPMYHRTVRFPAGATLVISHVNWKSTSSFTTEPALSTRRMETLSGFSGETILWSVKKKKSEFQETHLKLMTIKY